MFCNIFSAAEAASICVFFIRLSTKVYPHFLSSAGGWVVVVGAAKTLHSVGSCRIN